MRLGITFTTLSALLASRTLAVTVYTEKVATATADAAAYTAGSVDQTILQAPTPPNDQAVSVPVQLYDGGMDGISIPIGGAFLGFSIELSIANTLLGENAGFIHPSFLNFAAILESRGGGVTIRVGGNTQDGAVLNKDGNENGKTIQKFAGNDNSKTRTPIVHFTPDLFDVMEQIHKLVNVGWFFGIPFLKINADGNAAQVMQNALSSLGSNLLGLQMANEPDLYQDAGKKEVYNQDIFMADTTTMIQNLPLTQPIMVGPSICCRWTLDTILPQYLQTFAQNINYIDIIHYPHDNCAVGTPNAIPPQEIFPDYLSHDRVRDVLNPYFQWSQQALAAGKKIMMLETNTASCGGFPGVSNTFAASMWGVDFGLQMAFGNFSYALFHFGGQTAYYNPFTPPPTNMSLTHKWTVGSIFYSNVVVAEALGKSGNAQVVDLQLDNNNPNRAGYAIYEKGVASRVVLINYVSNPGLSDYTAVIGVGGGQTGLPAVTPASVKVKYLLASAVTQQYNITWAGQTLGTAPFTSDGTWSGEANVQTIPCDTTAGTCSIPVPAPAVALVFLTDEAYQNSGGLSGEAANVQMVYPTTTTTGKHKATMDPAVLATSNGHRAGGPLGATSKGAAVNDAGVQRGVSGVVVGVVSVMMGVVGAAWLVM